MNCGGIDARLVQLLDKAVCSVFGSGKDDGSVNLLSVDDLYQ